MKYVEYPPHPLLRNVIECYWTVTGYAERQIDIIYPDGCMDLLFDFSDTAKAFAIGNMTRPVEVISNGWTDILGVRFQPGGISAVVNTDLSQLTDQSAMLSDISLDASFERMAMMSTLQRTHFISDWLLERISLSQKQHAWQYCVSRLVNSRGLLPIVHLAKEVGVSQKQLERQFKLKVGVTPKQLAMTLRFRHSKNYLERSPGDLLQIATDLGFTDHAHFTHSFKSFSGLTPTQYLANRKNF